MLIQHWALLGAVVVGGAFLRFWGLGTLGLHGDEDVMALATRALVETQSPTLPSGMHYVRALPQLLMMSVSTSVFGDTEWALRLPSALVGSIGIFIAFWLARRFLSVYWALFFAVVFALLPCMIEHSQTARMYGVYVTCIMLFGVTLFWWERTKSIVSFLSSIAAALFAVSFHALAVFSIPLFFFPGLVRRSLPMLLAGGVAFLACVLVERQLSEWIGSQYFPLVERQSPMEDEPGGMLAIPIDLASMMVGMLGAALAAGAALVIARIRKLAVVGTTWLLLAVVCLGFSVTFGVLVQYHLAGLFFLLGTAFFVRAGCSVKVPIALGGLLAVLFVVHARLLWQSPEVQSINDLIESLAGTPYPKTYLSFSRYSPLGVIIYGLVFSYLAVQFSRGSSVSDHMLFFLMAVFAPLLLMGFLAGQYIPSRYVIGFLPLFLLALLAAVVEVFDRIGDRLPGFPRAAYIAAAIIVLLAFVNPSDFWYNVNARHEDFPRLTGHRGVDHKGAAEFVLAQHLDQDDIVIAVDTQQQVYYLGDRIDYYMRSLNTSRNSSFMREGRMLNLYTGVPQIWSGSMLRNILSEFRGKQVLVIGSGELEGNLMRYYGDGIWSTMEAVGFQEVFLGRDGATRVWRYSRLPEPSR